MKARGLTKKIVNFFFKPITKPLFVPVVRGSGDWLGGGDGGGVVVVGGSGGDMLLCLRVCEFVWPDQTVAEAKEVQNKSRQWTDTNK